MERSLNSGFAGILVLLIAVAVIIFFILRTDLFSGQKDGQNMIEQGRGFIDQAQNAKNLIEQNSRKSSGF